MTKKSYLTVSNYIDSLFPDAKCELFYTQDYELVIAVMLSAQTTDKAVNNVTKSLFKDYLSLNWPLYLLFTIGFAGGIALGYFWKQDISYMFSLALSCSALCVTFFLPFYFSNQEVIYDKYDVYFQRGTEAVAKRLVNMMQQNIDLTLEEKKRIEDSLENRNNPLEDNKEEGNKKDSDEP